MQTVFFGTPEAAVPALRALAGFSEIRFVITRPDRPRGRSGRPQPSAVKEQAMRLGLDVLQPEHPGEVAADLEGIDVAVLVAYGRLLPTSLLEAPRLGFTNVHFSALPRWRGAAPVAHALLAGDDMTGVTLLSMDEGLDTGPIIELVVTPIDPAENAGELTARLAIIGADLLAARLPDFVAGSIEPRPQEGEVTVAPKVTTADARLDPASSAEEMLRRIRAFAPKPGAWGEVDGSRLKVLKAGLWLGSEVPAPGSIEVHDHSIVMGTAGGAVELFDVQPAGSAPMAATAWANGRRNRPAHLE
jgi:methionyl-tRNA formyltransferase